MDITHIRNNIKNYYKQKKEDYWNNRKKRVSKRRNDKWNKYYQDSRWKLLRMAYHSSHPICECCLKQGIITNADHTHHIIPFSTGLTEEDKYNLLLDVNNLRSLCVHHHSIAHKLLANNESKKADVDDILAYEAENKVLTY